MIEKMGKVLFLGPENLQEELTKNLQELGVVQIDQYTGDSLPKDGRAVDTSKADNILVAYKTLLNYASHAEEIGELQDCNHSPEHIVENLSELEKELAHLKEEHNVFISKQESLVPWGKFDVNLLNEVKDKSNTAIQFWELQVKFIDQIDIPEVVSVIEIKHESMTKYFMTFAEEPIHIDNCLEIELDEDYKTIVEKIKDNEKKQTEVLKEIICFYSLRDEIYKAYIEELNSVNYQQALASSAKPLEGMVFALQGWCTNKQLKKVEEISNKFNTKIISIEPDKGERTPTTITNKGYSAIGQDLVEFYDTPSYKDWDPSFWIFGSFTVFFAMIMADGGYGLLLFLLLLYFKIKVKKPKPAVKRAFNMGLILTFATTVYGIMSGGFFGLAPSNPIFGKIVQLQLFNGGATDKISLDNMMRASVLIGMIHISLSLFLNSLRQMFSFKNFIIPFANTAWTVFIWAFFFWYGNEIWGIKLNNDQLTQIGGICGIVIFLTSAGTLHPGKMIGGGFGGLYNGVQFFSDVLSYIRIFALGLSGSLIAQTFNSMSYGIYEQGGAMIGLAVVVFILGHLLNIALCLMSAVIHGLRLNFLEYYRWSFDGGGRAFNPLKILSTK